MKAKCFLLLFCLVAATRGATVFQVTDISPGTSGVLFPGGADFTVLNNRGEAAGDRSFVDFSSGSGDPSAELLIYLPEPAYGLPAGLNQIPIPGGADSVNVHDFNDHGKIVGSWTVADTFFDNRGFIWDQGQFIDLGPNETYRFVNNNGWIAGGNKIRITNSVITISDTPFGLVRTNESDTVWLEIAGLNDAGQVLIQSGHSYPGSEPDTRDGEMAVFIWRDGTNQAVIPGIGNPTPDGEEIAPSPRDMNDHGEVVGHDGNGAWVYLPQSKYGLPAGTTFFSSFGSAYHINNSGVIILNNGSDSLFYWQSGRTNNVRAQMPPSDGQLYGLHDVNNAGQFLGIARSPVPGGAQNRFWILTPQHIESITVNDPGDGPDASPDDGVLDTDLAKPGLQVTLRAAIDRANSTNRPGPDIIDFDLDTAGPLTISPTNELPLITEALTIDGLTQPGTARVEISGLNAGVVDGLRISTTNCFIRGLAINAFQKSGLLIDGGHSHQVVGNIFGTDAASSSGKGNGIGIKIIGSISNILGGLFAEDRNVVSANLTDGISITNSSDIEVRANLIGTALNGSGNLPNGKAGLAAQKVLRLSMGTPTTSSVLNSGIGAILREVKGAVFINHYVGLNVAGNTTLGGTTNGLQIENSEDITVGGSSRNTLGGIAAKAISIVDSTNINLAANYIGTDRNGSASHPVGLGIIAERAKKVILGSSALTIISATNGVVLRNVTGDAGTPSSVENCNFGLAANGLARIGNMLNGLIGEDCENLSIGGTNRNVFGGIGSNALALLRTTNSQVAANYFGTDRNGNTSVPVGTGIFADICRGLKIGSSNLMSVICATNGAVLRRLAESDTSSNSVVNCSFGLNASGIARLGNMASGLVAQNSRNLTIGGELKNIFGGITANAVSLNMVTNAQLAANFFGTDRSGNNSVPVGLAVLADEVRDFGMGMSNLLSVVCATNGVVVRGAANTGTNLSSIVNCHFGLGSNGTTRLGMMSSGLIVERAVGLVVGGELRNVFGQAISNGASLTLSTNIQLLGNLFGTDRTGNTNGPMHTGIFADEVADLIIGSTNFPTHICATNGAILRKLSGLANKLNNTLLGLGLNGTNKLGTMSNGLVVQSSMGLTLGDEARNILGSTLLDAISLQSVTNLHIVSTWIGTDITGTNRHAIGGNGISATNARNLTIGNIVNKAASVLVGSCAKNGIVATDSPQLRVVNSSFGSALQANTRSLSNILSGLKVHLSAGFAASAPNESTVIEGNTVAFNGGSGVEITQGGGTVLSQIAHVIKRNVLRNNSGDGVRLGTNVSAVLIGATNLIGANEITQNGGNGVLMISPGERNLVELNTNIANIAKAISRIFDTNHLMQMQVVTALRGSTYVQGTVSGRPNETVRLHFYAHRPKAGTQGDGELWVGSVNVPLNGSGAGSYDIRLPRTAPAGWLVASTAADSLVGTSEFSNSKMVQPSPDTDGDGLPDFWEELYPSCLNPLVADPADEDCDGDGFTNLQEYIAHTDPTQANSALRVDNFTSGGNIATIRFVGVAGRQYGLERRPDVATGAWQRVATTIPETDGQVTLSDPAPPAGQMYYRLVAEFP